MDAEHLAALLWERAAEAESDVEDGVEPQLVVATLAEECRRVATELRRAAESRPTGTGDRR
jgi:hypothetical protein